MTAESQLKVDIGGFFADPLGYCMYAWNWDDPQLQVVKMLEPWASKYDSEYGLDGWQCEFMERLGEEIRLRGFDPDNPKTVLPVRMAVRSGHGIGKSALVGMLASFILDTRPGARGMVTANTGPQLHTKTWAQIKLWKGRAVTKHWWRILDTRIVHTMGENLGRLDAVTWKKENSEAFAGQHSVASSSFYMKDEASAIHESIWEVSEGGLTDGEPFDFAFGNPTRNVGRFHRCFGKDRHRWICSEVDSRSVQITNKVLIQEWIDDYGLDSDFVRVRVLGKEPKAGEDQLIPTDVCRRSMTREMHAHNIEDDEPVIMSIDVARSPLGDESVIAVRRGIDFRTHGFRRYRGMDTMQLAGRAAEWFEELRKLGIPPAIIFIDGGGVGGGVVDRLLQLGYPAQEVIFGGRADNGTRFKQKDAEMWVRLRAWMNAGGCLPDIAQLEEQLTGRPYDFTDDQRLYLWPKDKVKEELGLESPDIADAAALSFAFHVARQYPGEWKGQQPGHAITEYDEFAAPAA